MDDDKNYDNNEEDDKNHCEHDVDSDESENENYNEHINEEPDYNIGNTTTDNSIKILTRKKKIKANTTIKVNSSSINSNNSTSPFPCNRP